MRVGFLVWNRFQVGHFAEMMKHFDEPDVIFIDRDPNGLAGFDAKWLTQYGAYSRFIAETELASLDGQYDAILAQFTPPLDSPWMHTKLIMTQYSMAKPKTAYNARWMASDFGLVYGDYSDAIIGKICPTSQMGNPRFDPYFEGRLDPDVVNTLKAKLDQTKKTLAFLPTWGDLSSQAKFKEALETLLPHYNVLYKPHHMTPLKDHAEANTLGDGAIDVESIINVLDAGPYIMEVADIVISDMSGIIFDSIYCRKPIVLLGLDQNFEEHKKADPTALEVAHTDRIGPVVTDPAFLLEEVDRMVAHHPYREANEILVSESFAQRGGCGALAAAGIRSFLNGEVPHHQVNDYAAPNVKGSLLSKAYLAAAKRLDGSAKANAGAPTKPMKFTLSPNRSLLKRGVALLPSSLLIGVAKTAGKMKAKRLESFFYYRAAESGSKNVAAKWIERKKNHRLSRQIAMTPKQLRQNLTRLQDNGDFFFLGREVEKWAGQKPSAAKTNLYNYYCAAGNVRFSRARFREIHSSLIEYARSAEVSDHTGKRNILRDIGFLDEAVNAGALAPGEAQDSLVDTVIFLNEMAIYVERAAQNEGLVPQDRIALDKHGRWLPISEIDSPIFEMSVVLSFTRPLGQDDDGARKAMLDVTRSMIDALREDGWAILPRIQAGVRGASTVGGRYPSATWHTTFAGLHDQVHLKVGTFNSHIIIDSRGYSGWASLANQPLSEIVSSVSEQAADEQMKFLQETFVESGRSKFKQLSEEAVPDVGPYVFFPMQIMTDTVAKLAHVDGLTVLKTLSEWAKTSSYKVVVKRHPKCTVSKVADALRIESGLGRITLSNAPIHDLIAGADAIVTVNSGAGAEALMHQKHVITTGDSDYAAATTLVRSKEELLTALKRLPEAPLSENDFKRFLWTYSKRYQVHPDDVGSVKARVRELVKFPSSN